jgi:hypothetical protein
MHRKMVKPRREMVSSMMIPELGIRTKIVRTLRMARPKPVILSASAIARLLLTLSKPRAKYGKMVKMSEAPTRARHPATELIRGSDRYPSLMLRQMMDIPNVRRKKPIFRSEPSRFRK